MQTVFQDAILNRNFLELGYQRINQLISKEQVLFLADYYRQHPFQYNEPFVSTNYASDKNYRRNIFNTLDGLLFPVLDTVLDDYMGLTAAMFVKKARQKSEVGLHMDWQMVDEQQHIGLNVWMPLVNTNCLNGCIKVVPGSHRENFMPRGPNYLGLQDLMSQPIAKNYLKPLYLNAGDALIFDNRLVHLSDKNRWFKDRMALSYLMIPKSAQPLHFYFETEGKQITSIRKYHVDQSFYIEDIKYEHPNGFYPLSDGLGDDFEEVWPASEELYKSSVAFLERNFVKL
jgi:hypothetical protein